MNLKERGITVGDLLIIFIIILSATIIVKSLNNNKKTSIYDYQEKVSQNESYYQNSFIKNIDIIENS